MRITTTKKYKRASDYPARIKAGLVVYRDYAIGPQFRLEHRGPLGRKWWCASVTNENAGHYGWGQWLYPSEMLIVPTADKR